MMKTFYVMVAIQAESREAADKAVNDALAATHDHNARLGTRKAAYEAAKKLKPKRKK